MPAIRPDAARLGAHTDQGSQANGNEAVGVVPARNFDDTFRWVGRIGGMPHRSTRNPGRRSARPTRRAANPMASLTEDPESGPTGPCAASSPGHSTARRLTGHIKGTRRAGGGGATPRPPDVGRTLAALPTG